MKPIQEPRMGRYEGARSSRCLQLIIDRTSSKIVYADPGLDISEAVVSTLGLDR